MRSPFRVHGATVHEREGWIVRVDVDGAVGFGEAAPLRWFGTESWVDAGEALERSRGLVGLGVEDGAAWLASGALPPTAHAGLATALADAAARRVGQALATWLGASGVSSLAIHVPVGRGEDAADAALAAAASGVRHLKLKLGRSMIEETVTRIRDAVRVVPGLRVRLDANGAWSRDEAARWLDALSALPVDFVEQPVAADDVEGLVALAASSPVPVAIDEAMQTPDGAAAAREGRLPVVVLKPMVLGGPVATVALASACRAAGCRCVVTTFLDAAVGRAMATHVAAAVDADGAHGLATGGLLAVDVAAGPWLRDGRVEVPAGPGLGAAVDGVW